MGEDGLSPRRQPRKLVYDKDVGSYVFESREATLKRICMQRHKDATIVNRGEQLKLQTECHEFEKKQRLFSMHLSSERSASQHALKELVAHRHVLSAIATNNMKQQQDDNNLQLHQHDDKYGRYGDGAFKYSLLPQIEEEKSRMEPSQKRRAKCKVLLQKRRQMTVVQRNLSTPQIMRHWTKKKDEEEQQVEPVQRVLGRLVVPPLQARPQHRSTQSGDVKTILTSSRQRVPLRHRQKEQSEVIIHRPKSPEGDVRRSVSNTPYHGDRKKAAQINLLAIDEVWGSDDVIRNAPVRSDDVISNDQVGIDDVKTVDARPSDDDVRRDDDDVRRNEDFRVCGDDDREQDVEVGIVDEVRRDLERSRDEVGVSTNDLSSDLPSVFITHKYSLTHI